MRNLEMDNLLTIIVALLVIALTIVFIAIYRRGKSSRKGILLTGLCDSGKTLIFSQLIHQKHVQTHTSIKENVAPYIFNNAFLKIIDIPGHERLRDKYFEEYKSTARGIVFVVDSLTFQQDIRDAAEFLFNILSDDTISRNQTDMLILCNKQDQALAKGSNAIKSILEKELNTLRVTKSNQLQSVDPKARKTTSVGDNNKDFDFNSLKLKVEFGESFAFNKNGTKNIDHLTKWLSKVA